MSEQKNQPNNAVACRKLAKADANAVYALAQELVGEFGVGLDVDEEMVLPLVREIQGRGQAVASRIERYAELRDGEEES